jgi:hypothetical protein
MSGEDPLEGVDPELLALGAAFESEPMPEVEDSESDKLLDEIDDAALGDVRARADACLARIGRFCYVHTDFAKCVNSAQCSTSDTNRFTPNRRGPSERVQRQRARASM